MTEIEQASLNESMAKIRAIQDAEWQTLSPIEKMFRHLLIQITLLEDAIVLSRNPVIVSINKTDDKALIKQAEAVLEAAKPFSKNSPIMGEGEAAICYRMFATLAQLNEAKAKT